MMSLPGGAGMGAIGRQAHEGGAGGALHGGAHVSTMVHSDPDAVDQPRSPGRGADVDALPRAGV